MRRTEVGLAFTFVAMMFMVTACAGPDQVSSPVSTGSTSTDSQGSTPSTGLYLGPLKSAVDLSRTGVTLSPPGDVAPKVSWETAYATCTTGASVCLPGVEPTITLALATSQGTGTQQPDGTLTPLMKDTLIYVFTWTNEPCIPKGGPPRPSGAPGPTPQPCTLLAFMDANSGAALYGSEGPGPAS